MALIRTEHLKNYTVVNNTIIRDKRLSWKAKGIWLYAFSRPDDWTFHINDLINQSTDGTDSVRNGLKELEDAGYLKRERNRNEKGHVMGASWVFVEIPSQEVVNSQIISPKTENPTLVSQTLDKRTLLSTDKIPSTQEEQMSCTVHEKTCCTEFKSDEVEKVYDSSILTYTKPNGSTETIQTKEVWRQLLHLPSDVVQSAIDIFRKYEGHIFDPISFLKSTCKNIMNKSKVPFSYQEKKKTRRSQRDLNDDYYGMCQYPDRDY